MCKRLTVRVRRSYRVRKSSRYCVYMYGRVTFFQSVFCRKKIRKREIVEWVSVMKIPVASAEQQRSESPASTQNQKLENPDTTKEMTSKDGIGPKVMIKGGGKGGWLKAPLSEAQEPHGE